LKFWLWEVEAEEDKLLEEEVVVVVLLIIQPMRLLPHQLLSLLEEVVVVLPVTVLPILLTLALRGEIRFLAALRLLEEEEEEVMTTRAMVLQAEDQEEELELEVPHLQLPERLRKEITVAQLLQTVTTELVGVELELLEAMELAELPEQEELASQILFQDPHTSMAVGVGVEPELQMVILEEPEEAVLEEPAAPAQAREEMVLRIPGPVVGVAVSIILVRFLPREGMVAPVLLSLNT
jgi:hypothetical protein